MKILYLGIAVLLLGGCSTPAPRTTTAAAAIQPIDGTSIDVKKEIRFVPSLSGYFLPAGTYLPIRKDTAGTYYQSPTGVVALSLAGGIRYVGGIYRFRHRDGSIRLKVWCKTSLGMDTRELYDMVGANVGRDVVYNE